VVLGLDGALRRVVEEDLVSPLVVGCRDAIGAGICGVGVRGTLVGDETVLVVALGHRDHRRFLSNLRTLQENTISLLLISHLIAHITPQTFHLLHPLQLMPPWSLHPIQPLKPIKTIFRGNSPRLMILFNPRVFFSYEVEEIADCGAGGAKAEVAGGLRGVGAALLFGGGVLEVFLCAASFDTRIISTSQRTRSIPEKG